MRPIFTSEQRSRITSTSADPDHEPERWYFKDAICWFIEAPADDRSEKFGEGDHAFCFVIDPAKPSYGAWWRHGSADRTYIEEPIPAEALSYAIRMNPWNRSPGDFILEARVAMKPTLGRGDPRWHAPRPGDVYRSRDRPHGPRRRRLWRPPDPLRDRRRRRDLGANGLEGPDLADRAGEENKQRGSFWE